MKNKRRSLVTLLAIGIGFTAVNIFKGYTDNTYNGLRESAIRGEGLGHITIYKKGWTEHGQTDPAAYMLSREEYLKIIDLLYEDDDVLLATPRLNISGMVSNGRISTIFLASGVVPSAEMTIRGSLAAIRPVKGAGMNDASMYGIEMGEGLAKILNLKPGETGVVMAATVDGQINALDIEVAGTFNTGSDATNDKFMRVPFDFAQTLYETDMSDRVVVLLMDWKKTDELRDRLSAVLESAGLGCELRTWVELSQFYIKVKNMFDMIFTFIFCIVLIIVIMSIINTMSMSVLERTREIGTLRALGLKRRGVCRLFAEEGALLGSLGSIAGVFITVAVWGLICWIQPNYVPPGGSSPVPLTVNLVPATMVHMFAFLSGLSLISAVIPAVQASRQSVVEALSHV
ncbi:MAG: FtsX-like permease family protein [Pseudomonadota bacterium]